MTEPLGNGGSPLPESFEEWVTRKTGGRIEPDWVCPLITITLIVITYCIWVSYGG